MKKEKKNDLIFYLPYINESNNIIKPIKAENIQSLIDLNKKTKDISDEDISKAIESLNKYVREVREVDDIKTVAKSHPASFIKESKPRRGSHVSLLDLLFYRSEMSKKLTQSLLDMWTKKSIERFDRRLMNDEKEMIQASTLK